MSRSPFLLTIEKGVEPGVCKSVNVHQQRSLLVMLVVKVIGQFFEVGKARLFR